MIHSLERELGEEFDMVEPLQGAWYGTRYTAFQSNKSLGEIRKASDKVLKENHGWDCNHEHDCCGCWGLINMEVMQFPESELSFMLVSHWRQNV